MGRCIFFIMMLFMVLACKKESVNTSGNDPYQETVLPAILIAKDGISPAKGNVNDEVTIRGKGFLVNKDRLSVLFNGAKADIVTVTDTTVRVRVPAAAATGNVAAQVGQQYFFGPFFRVTGVFEMDTLFPGNRGANNAIFDIVPVEDNKYLITGAFDNYDNANIDGGVNRVARINHDGTLDRSFTYGKKTGTNSYATTAAMLPDGKYVVGGGFSNYENTAYVNSIARLYKNGALETRNITLPSGKSQVVSVLNGGVSGQVSKLFVQADGKMIATGNFRYYVQPDFNLVTTGGLDSMHLDSIQVNNLVRLHPDGSLDSSYNYDLANHRGREGANGFITASLLLPDGKLLIAGNFTRYNGQAAPRIARLLSDGSLDATFNSGSGGDYGIYSLTRQPDGKLLITGAFNSYNGQKCPRVARLQEDGSYDPSFRVDKGANGNIFNAAVMPGGEIILSGTFDEFEGLRRNNFIVLQPDGKVHPAYNTSGGISLGENAVTGALARIIQQPGERAMIAVGSFTRYDFRASNRIVRIKY
ncbi:IPT/TIG domain-containing protein [Chitinophaga solisilvae]|uniref:IPT/TIG domain-containing protein n=1 Tax=Chitinophaga solisilvae TaxID=1233460 RepID=UPI001368DE5B|nr:IPT/TIG domain-containing protein [Chitinophaga solisilvae]